MFRTIKNSQCQLTPSLEELAGVSAGVALTGCSAEFDCAQVGRWARGVEKENVFVGRDREARVAYNRLPWEPRS